MNIPKLTSGQYSFVINEMEQRGFPGYLIKLVADKMAPLLLGKKSFEHPLGDYPSNKTGASPEVNLIAEKVRRLKIKLEAVNIIQRRLKKSMAETARAIWALHLAKGMVRQWQPAIARLRSLENAVVKGSRETHDVVMDMNGKAHYLRTPKWKPIKRAHAPVHPGMAEFKATEYELGDGYENWERPVRVKPKREEVQLTEYEKSGTFEQMHVLPESVDYIIS